MENPLRADRKCNESGLYPTIVSIPQLLYFLLNIDIFLIKRKKKTTLILIYTINI